MLEALQAGDDALFLTINGGLSTPLLDGLMTFFTIAGDSVVWIGFGVLTILLSSPKGGKVRRLITFFVIMSIAGVMVNVAKEVVLRKRPLHHFRAAMATKAVVLHTPYNQLVSRSFPSGHSQAAFTAATFFALYYRRYRWALYGAASLVAFSRVYLGVHFPADIIAGAAMGWFIAWFCWRLDPITNRGDYSTAT